ncbi:unnamed protein product [Rotaria magnacalcarata]|uniref:Uncharacterized protein n=1 Tax=Rotaria magnacalcarata TaxID=392030 RepID=A0A816ZPQ7_9BILA|nr:unnamed protein product [Rotaria magnacalcarata]
MAKYCNTQSFETFVRLYSYSTHFCPSTMPIYKFLDYSFMYEYRPLNKLEIKLFRTLRIEVFNQNLIIINRFRRRIQANIIPEMNLNNNAIEFVLCFDHERKFRLEFIFGRPNCNVSFVLNTFDIVVVQVGYNGSKLISTLGFHQALVIRTFISYKLTHDINDVGLYIDRCFKYNPHGYT